jgi:hypothetical protein
MLASHIFYSTKEHPLRRIFEIPDQQLSWLQYQEYPLRRIFEIPDQQLSWLDWKIKIIFGVGTV